MHSFMFWIVLLFFLFPFPSHFFKYHLHWWHPIQNDEHLFHLYNSAVNGLAQGPISLQVFCIWTQSLYFCICLWASTFLVFPPLPSFSFCDFPFIILFLFPSFRSLLFPFIFSPLILIFLPFPPSHTSNCFILVRFMRIQNRFQERWEYTLDEMPAHPMAPCRHTFTRKLGLICFSQFAYRQDFEMREKTGALLEKCWNLAIINLILKIRSVHFLLSFPTLVQTFLRQIPSFFYHWHTGLNDDIPEHALKGEQISPEGLGSVWRTGCAVAARTPAGKSGPNPSPWQCSSHPALEQLFLERGFLLPHSASEEKTSAQRQVRRFSFGIRTQKNYGRKAPISWM